MGNVRTATVFHFDAERDRDRIVGRLCGDLDLVNAPRLREALTMLVEADADETVLDLSEVDFIDSSCLGVLVRASAQCKKQGHRFVLASPSRSVVRALAASGLLRMFAYDEATLADSVRAVAQPVARSGSSAPPATGHPTGDVGTNLAYGPPLVATTM